MSYQFIEQQRTEKGWLRHTVKEGARYHVLWWDSQGRHCSEPDCEVNHPNEIKGEK